MCAKIQQKSYSAKETPQKIIFNTNSPQQETIHFMKKTHIVIKFCRFFLVISEKQYTFANIINVLPKLELMNNYKTEALSEGIILTGKKSKHRYEIIQYLGRGGFGITYLAKETVTIDGIPQTHKYTIKEFCLSDICAREADGSISVSNDHLEEFKESKAEFLKEAEHLKELSHAGIVPVSEVFTMNNTVYYVMQYLGDTTLLKFIQQHGGTLDEDTALDITRKVAASLGYLHEHMMTHLDVKPDNIMML